MKSETAIIDGVIQIADKHFGEAGLELTIDRTPTSYWFLFGINLKAAVIPHTSRLGDAAYLAFLRRLFEEIFDFLMYAYDGDAAYTIHELSQAFGSGIDDGPLLPLLLPGRAQEVLTAVEKIAEAEHEDRIRRPRSDGVLMGADAVDGRRAPAHAWTFPWPRHRPARRPRVFDLSGINHHSTALPNHDSALARR